MKKLLEPEAFTRHLASATRRAGFAVDEIDHLMLQCRVRDKPLRCNLATAYSAYQNAPDRLGTIVEAHLAALQTAARESSAPALATPPLLPLINRATQLALLPREGMAAPLSRPLVADLVVTYVVDGPTSMAYLDARTIATLGAPDSVLEALHAEAIRNLGARTRHEETTHYGAGDSRFIVYEHGDGYAATRVLLDDLMASWAARLPGRMLVGLPNRDFLIACGDSNPQHVAAIASQVRRDAGRMPRPLADELFIWDDGLLRPRRSVFH